MKLQFVNADVCDIPVIFMQAKELIDLYEDIQSIDYKKVLSWMERKIANNIFQYDCVMTDGVKCAYYHLCEDGELDDVYVLPQYQNRGIGTAILEKCIAESDKELYLYVFCRNTRAVAFYERFGFSVTEQVGKTRMIMARKG